MIRGQPPWKCTWARYVCRCISYYGFSAPFRHFGESSRMSEGATSGGSGPPCTPQTLFVQDFSERPVTAKHFDQAKSKYVSKAEANAVTDNLSASSCVETDTQITCTFTRKAKPEGVSYLPHDTATARLTSHHSASRLGVHRHYEHRLRDLLGLWPGGQIRSILRN